MRFKLSICLLTLACVAYAKDPKSYQTGTVMQMDSVTRGVDEKDGRSAAGEGLSTDSGHKQTRELLCQEYVLQDEKVVYHVRPRDEKHPVLLPLGQNVQFRLERDKMLLRLEGVASKEHEYTVDSMMPRSDINTADAFAKPLNHLQ